MENRKTNLVLQILIWILEGIVVGFGAIVPGLSGGTLAYVFGVYRPIIEVISFTKGSIKKHWLMISSFVVGMFIGFVGLSGVISWLMSVNEAVVVCIFAGFVLGTLPEIWQDAGSKGRGVSSYVSLGAGFLLMLGLLIILSMANAITVATGFGAWLLCGLFWGLSFIVPGLSSSSFIMIFGLYEAMTSGISHLDLSVLFPMGIAMLATLLVFSQLMKLLYGKFHSQTSHAVLGIVVATIIMMIPKSYESVPMAFICIASLAAGAIVSFFFTRLCAKIAPRDSIDGEEEASLERP